MERMTKIDENIQTAQNMLSGIVERCYELEEENKKLKSDLAFERTMLDNVRAEYKSLQNVIKKLEEKRIFSLGEYDYMILTSTTPQLKIIKKNNKGASTFTIDGFTAVGKSVSSEFMEEDTLQELRDLGKI